MTELLVLTEKFSNIMGPFYRESVNVIEALTYKEVLLLSLFKKEPLRKVEASFLLGRDRASVSKKIDKLLLEGYLKREEVGYKYTITSKGNAFLRKHFNFKEEILEKVFYGKQRELEKFIEDYEKICFYLDYSETGKCD